MRMKLPRYWSLFVASFIFFAVFFCIGINKDLPYLHEIDEDFFVKPAVEIASTCHFKSWLVWSSWLHRDLSIGILVSRLLFLF